MFYEDPYLEFVHQAALEQGKYFLLDSGEGREFKDSKSGWIIEDLSGWLIRPSDHEKFICSHESGTADNYFEDEYVFAILSIDGDGQLKIDFKKY